MRPEDFIADRRRPFTGAEYMESLRAGREVYFDGERVTDISVHSAFRNSVRSIARLYDALHDPTTKDLLTCPTDTGSGGYTHNYFPDYALASVTKHLVAGQEFRVVS
jgi:4-hydroxyphenylacetate 3-monooxygenase